ncbi:MAG: DUF362 domain-containing protein [Deltaproteobacteria bacterium]|nr:DUF362 domain-containing protein [Deltaproteobacteria bacterium]
MGRGLTLREEGKSRVSISKGKDIARIVRQAITLVGGLEKLISSRARVLIKPNLSVALPAKTGVITDPRVVLALIQLVREAGAKEIMVGESAVVGFDAGAIFDALKVRSLFEKAGAKVVNLDQDQAVEVKIPKGEVLKKLKVCRTAYESDVIISVPKMKTHFQTGVTLSLKNMKGTVPDESKRIIHRIGVPVEKREEYGLDQAIVDLNTIISADLTVIDATISLEGFVPGPRLVGNPVRLDTIMAGFDPVAVDAVGCRVIGLDPREVRHIRLAYERKLGQMLLDEIEVVGRSVESVLHPLKTDIPKAAQVHENVTIIEGKGCSGCSVTNRLALSFFSPQDVENLGSLTLMVGDTASTDYPVKGRCFFIGNCSIRSNKGKKGRNIGGCPPPGLWIRKSLTGVAINCLGEIKGT